MTQIILNMIIVVMIRIIIIIIVQIVIIVIIGFPGGFGELWECKGIARRACTRGCLVA